jgi:hypothetical protein
MKIVRSTSGFPLRHFKYVDPLRMTRGARVYGSLPRLSEKVVAKLQRWRRLLDFLKGREDIFTR